VALPIPEKVNIIKGFEGLAFEYPDDLIVWCAIELEDNFNDSAIDAIFHHKGIMASYDSSFLTINKAVGYIDATPFVNVSKEVMYPSWIMSALVGGVHSSIIINFSKEKYITTDFEFYLNLLARKGMWQGLCCYSEPLLLKQPNIEYSKETSVGSYSNLFHFIRFHYKTAWLFYLLFCLLIFDRKFPFFSFCRSFFLSKSVSENNLMEGIVIETSKEFLKKSIDVLIPTIGRKKYLYDFLMDLKIQTQLPDKVIIIEQNTQIGSQSELDYLYDNPWPFEIKHIFTNQAGACNARNLGLKEVTGDWLFFADDDIRIGTDFLEKGLGKINSYGLNVGTFFCSKENEKPSFTFPLQWAAFGSGCSIVKTESLNGIFFDKNFEFGFGEDSEFGMQLRNHGVDIVYFSEPSILHLKAPIGGFRTKPILAWSQEPIQPKPSPTVMLFQLKYLTVEQQQSEKVKLFVNYYKVQSIKNPFRYFVNFNKQWEVSKKWALKLLEND